MVAATILVVDDERNILMSVSRALSLEGYEVEVAGSAEVALDKLDKKTFEAVLLDVQLPGIDGLAMLDELRKRERDRDPRHHDEWARDDRSGDGGHPAGRR